MKLYHFTSTVHLPRILEDRFIKRTDSMISANLAESMTYPTVVWLLDRPELDGYDHGLSGSIADKTEVRFTVDLQDKWVTRWIDYAHAQGADRHWMDAVIKRGGGPEAAAHWFISFKRVGDEAWDEVRNVKTGEVLL